MLRSSLAAVALAAAPLVSLAAGGSWDGIYSCAVSAPNYPASQVFITINGQPDGRSIFAVAALAPATDFYGFGIGQIQGSTFSGTTMFNRPFSVTANAIGFSGTVGIVVNGFTVNATAGCTKVW